MNRRRPWDSSILRHSSSTPPRAVFSSSIPRLRSRSSPPLSSAPLRIRSSPRSFYQLHGLHPSVSLLVAVLVLLLLSTLVDVAMPTKTTDAADVLANNGTRSDGISSSEAGRAVAGESGDFMIGTWKLESSDANFDDYLAQLGVGLMRRKLALTQKPVITITRESDGHFQLTTETSLRTTTVRFKLGEPFAYEAVDGKKVKAVVTLEANKLVLKEEATGGRPENVVERTFDGRKMTAVSKCGSVTSKRVFLKTG